MSGIFGNINKYPYNTSINDEISGMRVWNQPYGKHASDICSSNDFYLGCCLDKINHSLRDSTPIIKRNGYYAVIDTLIYNRNELLTDLSLPHDISDEELLLYHIEKNGPDSLKTINGDFAGAIYYPEKKELLVFRDHMGIRTLFYLVRDDFIAFSTDIRGLTGILRANVKLDEVWIYKTLKGFISTESIETEYADLFCVEPGSYITFSFLEDQIRISKKNYWTPGQKKIKLSSDKEYQENLKELITDSIRSRLEVTHGEVGAELSGGLDSGVISILINRLGRKCTYYSWSYDPKILPYAEKDERLVIKDICDHEKINCNYHKYIEKSESIIEENIRNTGLPLDDGEVLSYKFADPAYINTKYLTDTSLFMHSSGINVVFTGHGGDEGVSHRANGYEMVIYHEYLHYLKFVWASTHGHPHRIYNTLKKIRRNVKNSRSFLKNTFYNGEDLSLFLNKELYLKYKDIKASACYFAYDPIKYILHGGSRNRLDNIALQGAYCGVRYLVPYLDYRVIDYAVSIPRYQYLRGRKNRYIFREAFKDIMPKSLYAVTEKADNSVKDLKPNPNWYEKYIKHKKDVVSRFAEEKWGNLLNFSELKNFLKKEKPDDNERARDYEVMFQLQDLFTAQNALDKSREASMAQKK